MHTQKGFTLIELLVVVAIIGLLSSVVLASLQGARSKARDTKRVAETRSIEKALLLYSLDHNGLVPYSTISSMASVTNPNGTINCTARGSGSNYENTDQLFNLLVNGKYLSAKPAVDPQESLGYCYVYITSSVAVAGAEYDAQGRQIFAAVPGSKARNAVFFAPSENTQTITNKSALIGISVGTTPPVTLNVDLTTGLKHNTVNYDVGSGSGSDGSGSGYDYGNDYGSGSDGSGSGYDDGSDYGSGSDGSGSDGSGSGYDDGSGSGYDGYGGGY